MKGDRNNKKTVEQSDPKNSPVRSNTIHVHCIVDLVGGLLNLICFFQSCTKFSPLVSVCSYKLSAFPEKKKIASYFSFRPNFCSNAA